MNQFIVDSEPQWIAGFMSGTSLDAVDAALIRTDGHVVREFGPAAERKYTTEEREVLQEATTAARDWAWQGARPEAAFDRARQVITHTHRDAWQQLLADWDGPAPVAAGVHGQTVLHRRATKNDTGATLQLIDADSLRAALDVPLVYDLRSKDVAAGGQGAPLAPAYHGALLAGLGVENGCVLNLGGVANITSRQADGALLAFDTGPANGPIDEWIEQHGAGTYDADGAMAAAGRVNQERLNAWLAHAWFSELPPKSLDRFDFSAQMAQGLSLEDGAATLTAFSAQAVAAGVAQLSSMPSRVIVCGGGRHNPILMRELSRALPCPVETAEQVGWRGDSIEAEAFAFLAARSLRGLPISWPMTTGVPAPMSGGEILP